jgi:hypothetical protein
MAASPFHAEKTSARKGGHCLLKKTSPATFRCAAKCSGMVFLCLVTMVKGFLPSMPALHKGAGIFGRATCPGRLGGFACSYGPRKVCLLNMDFLTSLSMRPPPCPVLKPDRVVWTHVSSLRTIAETNA